MPVIKGFRATTIWKAFALNALATSFAIVLALEIKARMDRFVDKRGDEIREVFDMRKTFLTFIVTFIATFFAYTLLHVVFGYGGGQLAM